MRSRNFVAKYAHKFNRSQAFTDRKRAAKNNPEGDFDMDWNRVLQNFGNDVVGVRFDADEDFIITYKNEGRFYDYIVLRKDLSSDDIYLLEKFS